MTTHSLSCRRFLLALVVLPALFPQSSRAETPQPAIDFNRHIRPLLSENCFACHGPDEKQRKARLRLDTREGAFAKLRGGQAAIVPGKPTESELIARVTATEPGEIMPPPKSNKKLKLDEIALLKRWVEEGAVWSEHWAFASPKRPTLPRVRETSWPRTPIDYFILARLEAERLKPSPEADKTALLRRVAFDLTGLPPTLPEIDAFLTDTSPEAYERLVDRLLRSPRYGEHMARFWLDAARYGDTHGLHLDNFREMWLYRDWVVDAFNRNLPYDRFVLEQLAGDLLPEPTLDQQIATGFNRCHVTTNEGGSIEDECYVRNVVDRVDTTGTVLMGLSIGCARCHDHKYDPIRMKDYYQLFAFFNSLDGKEMDGNSARYPPIARKATPEQAAALAKLEQQVETLKKQIAAEVTRAKYDDAADEGQSDRPERAEVVWIDDDLPAGARASSAGGPNGAWEWVSKPQPVFSGGKAHKRIATELAQHYIEAAKPGLRVGEGDVLFAYVYLDPANPPKEIMLQWHSDAWRHRAYWGENRIDWGADNTPERRRAGALPESDKWVRLEVDTATVGLKPGSTIVGWAFTQFGGTVYWDRAGVVTRTPQGGGKYDTFTTWLREQKALGGEGLPRAVQNLVRIDTRQWNDRQRKLVRDHFIEFAWTKTRTTFEPLHKQLDEAEKQRSALDQQLPSTLIFKESATPKTAYILKRGEYDQKGDPVGRDTPAFLPPLPAGAPKNRLGLAQWLLQAEHPLTARVAVNRFWQQCFGTGLVKTAEDFGSQGEPPSHPELLDWLAVQFREDGWDVKQMMKRIVMSATYRQSAKVTPDRLAKDRDNRLLSRGPRFRLDAETLRDQALAVSGLLVEKLGGPGVKPPQPSGLWEAVGYLTSNTRNFVADTGHEKVHRRSLYTFWKRTAPPPQMNAFDAPSREACRVRRERTNTPLQALLLMNDPQYLEAARVLAERALHQNGSVEDRLTFLFRLATARRPDERELAELRTTLADHLAEYRRDTAGAKELIAVGETKPDPKLDAGELAAWTMVANLVLNLDEVLTK